MPGKLDHPQLDIVIRVAEQVAGPIGQAADAVPICAPSAGITCIRPRAPALLTA